jgi:predicted transcriptional regulator
MMICDELRLKLEQIPNIADVSELSKHLAHLYLCVSDAFEKNAADAEYLAHVVQKAMFIHAKNMHGQKSFLCGKYYAKIDQEIDNARSRKVQLKINSVMESEIAQIIVKYLWNNGCTMTETMQTDIDVDWRSLDNAIEDLVSVDLVIQSFGSHCSYCELTPSGYKYCREHFERRGKVTW